MENVKQPYLPVLLAAPSVIRGKNTETRKANTATINFIYWNKDAWNNTPISKCPRGRKQISPGKVSQYWKNYEGSCWRQRVAVLLEVIHPEIQRTEGFLTQQRLSRKYSSLHFLWRLYSLFLKRAVLKVYWSKWSALSLGDYKVGIYFGG